MTGSVNDTANCRQSRNKQQAVKRKLQTTRKNWNRQKGYVWAKVSESQQTQIITAVKWWSVYYYHQSVTPFG